MRTYLVTIALVCISLGAFAQKNVMNKGDVFLNLGVGVGDTYLSSNYNFTPGINLSGEIGMFPTGDIGIVSLGGIVAVKASSYSPGSYTDTYFGTAIQFRGAWHLSYWDNPDFDVYAGLGTGFRFNSTSTDRFTGENSKITTVDLVSSVFVGGRWMMKDNFGFFGEVGYDASSIAKVGITYKF